MDLLEDVHLDIRKVFFPPPGELFVRSDYSQLEVRLAAHYSGDKLLIEALLAGGDIHSHVARQIFNLDCTVEEVKKKYKSKRSAAKAIVFGLNYGITAVGLARRLRITEQEAQEYIDAFFAKYTGLKAYMDACRSFVMERKFISTILGNRRHFDRVNNRSFRQAMNFPIQSTAAEVVKTAMVEVWTRIRPRHDDIKMLMQIHDELLLQCKIPLVTEVQALLKESMELGLSRFGIQTAVPLTTDPEVDYSWGFSVKAAKHEELECMQNMRLAFDAGDVQKAEVACDMYYTTFFRELKKEYPQEYKTLPGNTVLVVPNQQQPVFTPDYAQFREGELRYLTDRFERDTHLVNYRSKFWH